ncbi:MAG: sulfotransferase [Rhodobacteraceae bacterium]|nr:sulfotransferase [Paracoccaceae bacterium]
MPRLPRALAAIATAATGAGGRAPTPAEAMAELARTIGPARAPDFYGIGAEKAGTTWLWQMFRDHPAIGVPRPKELRYFAGLYLGTGAPRPAALPILLRNAAALQNRPLLLAQLATEIRLAAGGDEAYLRILGKLRGDLVGDISPQYCMLRGEGLAHMQRLAPAARILLLMRDPVARAISGGKMKAAAENPEFDEARLRAHTLVTFQLDMSRYTAILERFEAAFPGRVWAGFFDDIVDRPLAVLEEICAFLGVEFRAEFFPRTKMTANPGKPWPVSPDLRREAFGLLADEYDRLEARFPARVAAWRTLYAR